jgi:SpoVK/Ycf46/Vps4 family AAA+-type ATPase
VSYEGVFIVGSTNIPKAVPDAVMRRFKYVDVVGQLTKEERSQLFKQFLLGGMPIHQAVNEEDYMRWAEMLDHAPGDVLGKVADEIHFKFMREFVDASPKRIAGIERALARKLRDRESNDRDRAALKTKLAAHHEITAEEITQAIETTLKQPQIQMQIESAKQVYRDADEIMKGLSKPNGSGLGFGAQRKNQLWSRD